MGGRWRILLGRSVVTAVVLATLQACSVFAPAVQVRSMDAGEYITLKRGDILTRESLSDATEQTIRVTGLDEGACAKPATLPCIAAMTAVAHSMPTDRRLSAVAELWMLRASTLKDKDERLLAWLEAARYAYAYLFFSDREPGERAFEDRQTQVRDWYNHAVQQAAIGIFDAASARTAQPERHGLPRQVGDWTLSIDTSGIRLPAGASMPAELLPASSLSFRGLRSLYRRDGLGAELVAPVDDSPQTTAPTRQGKPATRDPALAAWSEMPAPSLTVLLQPEGESLEAVLNTRRLKMSAHDPYRASVIEWQGQRIPLAANFTAGYGLWLARSGFNQQSLLSLLGREGGIQKPHVYLMQPYDPNRRVIVMLHGLASSPEAWVNLANEIMGDEALRRHYQIWQVYYPTNLPIVLSHAMIRQALQETFEHFDPSGQAPASSGFVLIGHSMGGVISRLMASSAEEELLDWARHEHPSVPETQLEKAEHLFRFQPVPNAERVIFIAAPHRGTAVAGHGLARWLAGFIRLPVTLLENVIQGPLSSAEAEDMKLDRMPNSVNNLDQNDPFMKAAADLPISDQIKYHSIIAQRDPEVALLASDDGLVPYGSAHLPGAISEQVIISGHSVQQRPAAILEIQRILHEDMREMAAQQRDTPADAPPAAPVDGRLKMSLSRDLLVH